MGAGFLPQYHGHGFRDGVLALITVVSVVVDFLHQFGEGKAGAGESPISPEERGVGGMDFDHQSHGLVLVHDALCAG